MHHMWCSLTPSTAFDFGACGDVQKATDMATDTGVQQRSACMPWIIAGDLNLIFVRWLNGQTLR